MRTQTYRNDYEPPAGAARSVDVDDERELVADDARHASRSGQANELMALEGAVIEGSPYEPALSCERERGDRLRDWNQHVFTLEGQYGDAAEAALGSARDDFRDWVAGYPSQYTSALAGRREARDALLEFVGGASIAITSNLVEALGSGWFAAEPLTVETMSSDEVVADLAGAGGAAPADLLPSLNELLARTPAASQFATAAIFLAGAIQNQLQDHFSEAAARAVAESSLLASGREEFLGWCARPGDGDEADGYVRGDVPRAVANDVPGYVHGQLGVPTAVEWANTIRQQVLDVLVTESLMLDRNLYRGLDSVGAMPFHRIDTPLHQTPRTNANQRAHDISTEIVERTPITEIEYD